MKRTRQPRARARARRSAGAGPAPRAARTNLGRESTSFVGRARELAELERLLDGGALLVSLLGPGGTGKTRLARRLGRARLEKGGRRGPAVWFCDLTVVQTLDELVAAVAAGATVAAPAAGGDLAGAARRLGASLAARGPQLLILDNAERIASAAAAVLAPLLEAAPGVQLLVTSREPLGMQAEVQLPIAPLAAAEGKRLFVERARSRRPSWRPTAAETAAVAEIVRHLDGLPLAIELAAAWMGTLTPPALLARLEDRFRLLRADTGDRPPRHASLRAAIESSWELLDERLRGALARLSVFEGGASLEGAEVVLADVVAGDDPGGSGAALLRRLAERGLLRADRLPGLPGERRYALYETVRAYAREALDRSGARAAVERRHAEHHIEYCAALAALLQGPRETEALRRLAAEADNLNAAFRRLLPVDALGAARALLALEPVYLARGPYDRYAAMVEAVVPALSEDAPPALRARVLLCRSRIRRLVARLADAESDALAARCLADEAGEPVLAGDALMARAPLLRDRGRLADAEADLRAALALFERAVDRRRQGDARERLGLVLCGLRRVEESRRELHAAIDIAREVGNRRGEGTSLADLGTLLHNMGRHGEARDALERAAAIARALPDGHFLVITLAHLTLALLGLGAFAEAHGALREGRRTARRLASRRGEAELTWLAATLAGAEGRLAEAAALFEQALAVGVGRVGAVMETAIRAALAAVDAERGQLDRARERFAEMRAAPHAARSGVPLLERAIDLTLAREAHARGEAPEARARLAAVDAALAVAVAAPFGTDEELTALVLLRAARARSPAAAAGDAREAARRLEVSADGRWFSLDGQRVDLGRRGAPARVLAALAAAGRTTPGRPLSQDELLARGWPGQRVLAEAGTMRVYAAVAALRRLGLRDVLVTREDGYLLDPPPGAPPDAGG